ncbi:DNA polymerase V subunit UmuC [Serratia entomophila]|nr:Sea13 [Serratia entomophila]ULG14432.1 Sea13 [Serratia proteamaculans]CAI1208470.1 DNA polymerase V subunit UmuC [Serratia quinivorans]ULG10599.1 Sea13 [Serratia entomophila]ULG10818.1 Sea13 [Serratia entomophila]
MHQAVCQYAERAAEKLRRERQYCRHISVFLRTSPFAPHDPYYANSNSVRLMLATQARVQKVAETRRKSPDKGTQKLALRPHQFRDLNNPSNYILVPSVSSERRIYVPLGFFDANVISTNLNFILPHATLYEFGILSSLLHNDWMRLVAGRLKSDYRYSATVVYNTFPWPSVTPGQREEIKRLAEEMYLTRDDFPGRTLAELYDPDKMPPSLLAAHQALDVAVDKLYRDKPFRDAADRLNYLLARYEGLTKK